MLSLQRSSERGEIEYVRRLYGLKNMKHYCEDEIVIYKKKIHFCNCMVAITLQSYSQTSGMETSKKTQKKYLLQQIAALKVYISYAKKGYNIVSSGINTIRDIKKGELNLHNNFYNRSKVSTQDKPVCKSGGYNYLPGSYNQTDKTNN